MNRPAPAPPKVELARHDGQVALLWRAGPGWRMLSSAVAGGGSTTAGWVLNLQVPSDYTRRDPATHIAEFAEGIGLTGPGIGMLTAAQVGRYTIGSCDGAQVIATTGLSHPVWAAPLPENTGSRPGTSGYHPGTINLIAVLPVRLGPAAEVDAVTALTEAKTQALVEAGVPGTGTASDALCVASATVGEPQPFCGTRSLWGRRLAISCHQAVTHGIERWTALFRPAGSRVEPGPT